VLATNGPRLGGDDLITPPDHCCSPSSTGSRRHRIGQGAGDGGAKRALSSSPGRAQLVTPDGKPVSAPPRRVRALVRDRRRTRVRRALRRAGVEPADILGVVAVGIRAARSCAPPWRAIFAAPLTTIVRRSGALGAGIRKHSHGRASHMLLLDVIPLSLGSRPWAACSFRLIDRNHVPVSVKGTHHGVDNQTSVASDCSGSGSASDNRPGALLDSHRAAARRSASLDMCLSGRRRHPLGPATDHERTRADGQVKPSAVSMSRSSRCWSRSTTRRDVQQRHRRHASMPTPSCTRPGLPWKSTRSLRPGEAERIGAAHRPFAAARDVYVTCASVHDELSQTTEPFARRIMDVLREASKVDRSRSWGACGSGRTSRNRQQLDPPPDVDRSASLHRPAAGSASCPTSPTTQGVERGTARAHPDGMGRGRGGRRRIHGVSE
jgi:hypothetical protein